MVHECVETLTTTQLLQEKASSPNTKSTSTTETVRGEHRFDIAGYSRKQGVGAGNVLTSATFAVGGFDWAIRYYPDGKGDEAFVSGS
ncbi:BTB/POZ and MATH domain-containing protein 4-like [Panicum miliaceum]|uniref:BTB/POZ and MATH domain-containing protein 4-like n=1 Tax=Panicum miliaceum TaxID=4540 RepID=A0A3L6PQN6_PANMI|nr:BTB/POZ and MATH domain-containing protein 4-like [Panicum miliaceum]